MFAPSLRRISLGVSFAAVAAFTVTLAAQIPSRNVNMVSGLEWPGGDPFLQRQNEPSIAASTRNPLHLLAGSNDYRSVDLPGLETVEEVGDAWLGLYTSTDAGDRWTSTLVPGYPQDTTAIGHASPLFGYHAAADPVVRAGTNGLIYYAGLAFDRTSDLSAAPGKSAIFVARLIDNNNQEAPDPDQHLGPFEYVGTTLVTSNSGAGGVFLDKPWMAVDIPRAGAATCPITTNNEHGPFTQSLPAGNIYVAYTMKSTDAKGDRWDLYFSRSTDCGVHFTSPVRISRVEDRVNQGAHIVIAPTTGDVFIAWRRIDLAADNVEEHAIVVAKSTDQGKKFNPPGVARRFPRGKKKGLNPTQPPGQGQAKKPGAIQAAEEFELAPFDQSTSAFDKTFRSRAYPTMTADGSGRLYLAWAERGYGASRSDPADGDARILITTSMDGGLWTTPKVVADVGQLGHQIMPALSFAGGKLMLAYYDLQEDRSQVFTKQIDDKTAFDQTTPDRRHTIDIRVSMAAPGASPVFEPSRSVSQYLQGTRDPNQPLEQLQVNPPNLPMFKQGTVPFIGDYIDLAPAPAFVPAGAGGWTYNTAAGTTPPVFHAAWTDNRDVRPPFDKDWRHYTAPVYPGLRPNPNEPVTVCLPGYAGSRNQNIYSARVTGGLVVGSPQNSKQLSPSLQRAFVVFAQNTSDSTKTFRMTILNQPLNGRASFNQFPLPPFTPSSEPPLTFVDITTPKFTTASRTVYVTSTDPHARVNVDVSETLGVGQAETPGGLEGLIALNPDVLNPEVDNPEVDNPEVDNPEVDNAEVYNPEVDNPEVDNPEVDNPEVDNPEVDNPEVDNIVVGNPEVDNPEVDNPEVDNPEVDNPEVDNPEVDNQALIAGGGVITDVTWTIRNIGNTTTAYNVNLFLRHATLPTSGRAQLLVYRVYKTPIITMASCDVKTVTQNVLAANIPDPRLILPGGQPSDPNDSDRTNATLWIEPGKEMRVTVRVFDPVKADNVILHGASIDPDWIPEADVSLLLQSQPVNTPDAPFTPEPPLIGADPSPLMVTTTANAGPGSLRDAMLAANALPGLNYIHFNIPGPGVHTITPLSTLPWLTEAVIVDGSTQPGYAGVPLIDLDGSSTGGGTAIQLNGGASLVRGLTLNNWGDYGIGIDLAGGNEVYGNYIGVDATGTAQAINGQGGINIFSGGNVIGGVAPLDRNVISGNGFWGILITASGNTIESNYIGVNAAGDARIDNGFGVFAGGSANVLHGNVISGNFSDGIDINGSGNTITANRIGTNAAGTAAVGNGAYGIRAFNAANLVIGSAGAGNIISGNANHGIYITTSDDAVIQGNLIGVNATGTAAIGNLMGIQDISLRARIGGTGIGDGNVISGNTSTGLYIQTDNTTVEGNFIGTNAAGTASVPNLQGGIVLSGGANNVIGGGAPNAGNVISGNVAEGVYISSPVVPPAFNTSVISNHIGTNAAGTLALPNTQSGIALINSATFSIWNNVISGNGGRGMLVFGSNDISIAGNTIGTNGAGNAPLPNLNGIYLFNSNDISVNGNLISGNLQAGIQTDGNTSDVSIRANKIGTDFVAVGFVPNGMGGIVVAGSSSNMRIGVPGQENVIGGNFGPGVEVNGFAATIMIGPDAIYGNLSLPIDLAGDGTTPNDAGDGDGGPNQQQNFPVFVGPGPAGSVNYTLDSAANQDYTLFFYTSSAAVNDMGTFLGSAVVHTDLVGHFAGIFNAPSGTWVTATATDVSGNTSELSVRILVP